MTRKQPTRHLKETSLRHVWLASLGTIEVARRGVSTTAQRALSQVPALRAGVVEAAADALAIARGDALVIGEQLQPRFGRISAEVEARLQLVLAKWGVATGASSGKRAQRKPGARAAHPRARKAGAGRNTRSASA